MRTKALRVAPALMLAFFVCGCASVPKVWTRPDGKPIDPAQLQLDDTACRGETEKAAAQGGKDSTINMPGMVGGQDRSIYLGCMAQRGYLAAK